MGQIASLIIQKLKRIVQGKYWRLIEAKRKAITALLPYALREERDGQPEMFDTFIQAVRASKDRDFTWHWIRQYASSIPHETSPRAIVLVLPYFRWGRLTAREDLIRRWAAAASEVPCTEEVTQSVVDTLLQIASQEELIPHIPADAWSWLNKRPSLLPICRGRDVGTRAHVIRAVRALKDIETLKSYFLLVWSEWSDFPSDEPEHTISIDPPPLWNPSRMTPMVQPGQLMQLPSSSERGSGHSIHSNRVTR